MGGGTITSRGNKSEFQKKSLRRGKLYQQLLIEKVVPRGGRFFTRGRTIFRELWENAKKKGAFFLFLVPPPAPSGYPTANYIKAKLKWAKKTEKRKPTG